MGVFPLLKYLLPVVVAFLLPATETPHHPDFKLDGVQYMKTVAAATAAAPTFFQPLRDGGYAFVDGGVWANNPVMVGVVDALSCFDLARDRISVLSLGCGTIPCSLNRTQMLGGVGNGRSPVRRARERPRVCASSQSAMRRRSRFAIRRSARAHRPIAATTCTGQVPRDAGRETHPPSPRRSSGRVRPAPLGGTRCA